MVRKLRSKECDIYKRLLIVKFARQAKYSKKNCIFTVPQINDCSEVCEADIVSLFPAPKLERRAQISFDSFNIQ